MTAEDLRAQHPSNQSVARPLKVLVPLIQRELTAGDSAGLEHYRQAGEMLLEAREQVVAFKWTAWLSKNFTLSKMTAWRYMRLATIGQFLPIREERQVRDEEVGLHRELALELIDIGYKARATRLHPDRGGSKDAMRRLNRVRAELKGVAETRRFE